AGGIDTTPWNPPVLDSNLWPYGKEPCCVADEVVVGGYNGEFWLSGEYWLGNIKNDRLPRLFLEGTSPSTVLTTSSKVDQGILSGGRFVCGVWFDQCNRIGIEGSYFFLSESAVHFSTTASGADGVLVPSPALPAGGAVNLAAFSDFQGAEANAVVQALRSPNYRIELLAGFRWMDLEEEIQIQSSVPQPALELDRTSNQFYLGQLGVRGEVFLGRWYGGASAKLALGRNLQQVDLN